MNRNIRKKTICFITLIFVTISTGSCSYDKAIVTTNPTATSSAASAADVYPENGLPRNIRVELNVGLFKGGNGRQWYDYCVETFTRKFPNVSFTTQYSSTVTDIVNSKMSSGNEDSMFDLFNANWLPLAKNGKLEPLDDIFERNLYDSPDKKLKEMLNPGTVESIVRYDNVIYTVSPSSYIGGLFFDKNFFAEKGWDTDPKTWDEFWALCQQISGSGVSPIIFPGLYPDYIDNALLVKVSDAAEILNDKQFSYNWRNWIGPQYTSPEVLEVYRRIYSMGKMGFFYPDLEKLSHIQAQSLVINHKAAMVSTGDWVVAEMQDYVPEDYEWGYMAVPFGNDPDQTIHIRNGINYEFMIWKSKPSLNKEWAKEFLLWMMNLDSQEAILEKGGALPLRKGCMDYIKSKSIEIPQNEVLKYIDSHNVKLESGRRDISIINYNTTYVWGLLADAYVPICLGKQNPLPVLKKVEEILQKELALTKK